MINKILYGLIGFFLTGFNISQNFEQKSMNLQGNITSDTTKELSYRLRRDYNLNSQAVILQLKKYYPTLTAEQLRQWADEKRLEMRIIDGKECYFRHAAANLLKADKEAKTLKNHIDGTLKDPLNSFLKTYLTQIINELQTKEKQQSASTRFKIKYTLTVSADAVPAGEIIRCWLPYPQEKNRRQFDVNLLTINAKNYTISPDTSPQRTIYIEKTAQQNTPTVFSIEFLFSSVAEKIDIEEDNVLQYDTHSALWQTFTQQKSPHILFTPSIEKLSSQIIDNETNPLKKAKKIYNYICSHYPWTSAPEYSIIENIPQYVIDYKRGDCGMVSLLFITLCRYNGIPAKWQSGFMLHPGKVNLHDWAEIYFEGIGWMVVDCSFGRRNIFFDNEITDFYFGGTDVFRWIVNEDVGAELFPKKQFLRSETVDFQRGEVEWRKGNLYFDKWRWNIKVEKVN
ncbi:MAG: transglutaminase domain-containing protein [Bacteroidales bacterium]|jgi:transglutaminase-like putative cysteine protease|nr:transglutaminase domain-containing protein [Bacteroidales bacterium]